MTFKVFYSWQSDLPGRLNRNFIEKALKAAIKDISADAELLAAAREDIVLDKDTSGVPGHPPIADTIFSKIAECSVFVADLTFVGRTEGSRPVPNPNVLIEYGWALSQKGHKSMMLLMNTAFGEPTADNLPFDLRHYRWPTRYKAARDSTKDELRQERTRLQTSIRSNLSAIIRDLAYETEKAGAPINIDFQLVPKSVRSSFLSDGEELCHLRTRWGDEIGPVIWNNRPQAFLRVIPDTPTVEYTQYELVEILRSAHPPLLGRSHGLWWEQNEWGAVVFESDGSVRQTEAHQLVQVTSYGEIWAIDQTLVGTWNDENIIGYFEQIFLDRLEKYLAYCRDRLNVKSAVTVELGFTSVKGYRAQLPPPPSGTMRMENIGGHSSANDLVEIVKAVPLNAKPLNVLAPSFVKLWGRLGLPRFDYLPQPDLSA